MTLVVLAIVVVLAAYSRLHAGGFSAESEPGALERTLAPRLMRLSIPADAQQRENPFREDATVWRTAVDHFEDHCATCHGDDGRGRVSMGENMYPNASDLSDSGVQNLSDGALFYIIQNGVRWTGMPGWKYEHSADDTWRLVSFIRQIPTLSPADLASARQAPHADEHERESDDHRSSDIRQKTETPEHPQR